MIDNKYIIYHIPGKKIGVTNDLYNRVEQQQGYEVGEYEILESSDDIKYISKREIELQKKYDLKINWKPSDLMEIFAIHGVANVKDRPKPVQLNRLTELKRWSKFLGTPLTIQPKFFPVDPTLSHRTIILAQKNATEIVFNKKKIPFRTFEVNKRDEKTLGEIFTFFILETILIGRALKINPFDQPSVELIKKETKKILY